MKSLSDLSKVTKLISDRVKIKILRVQLQSLCTYGMVSQKGSLCLVSQRDFYLFPSLVHSCPYFYHCPVSERTASEACTEELGELRP